MSQLAAKPLVERGLLPHGWQWVKLSDVGALTDGDWILTSDYANTGVRLIQVGDVGRGKFVGKSSRYITLERAKELGCTFLQKDDILISRMPDPMGRACLMPDLGYPCITAVDVSIWRPNLEVTDREFLVHYLNSAEWFYRVEGLASGATRQRISRSNLENLTAPLPPLPEQKRIAAILKEQMAAVERARAAAEEQLKAAKDLPAAYLRSIFNSPEASEWERMKVGQLCARIDYGYTASADFTIKEPKFLRITDIQDGEVDWENVPGCRITIDEETANALADGDIVFARTGGTTGKSFLIREPPQRAVFASYLIRLRPNKKIASEYLYAFFQSNDYWKQVWGQARGGAQPNVNATLLGGITLPVAPLVEQHRITSFLDAHLSKVRDLRKQLQDGLDSIEKLPTALLRAAFTGKL